MPVYGRLFEKALRKLWVKRSITQWAVHIDTTMHLRGRSWDTTSCLFNTIVMLYIDINEYHEHEQDRYLVSVAHFKSSLIKTGIVI